MTLSSLFLLVVVAAAPAAEAPAEAPVEVIEFRGGFDIVAPWGERQRRSKGYLLLNRGEVYGIYEPIFDKTYNRV